MDRALSSCWSSCAPFIMCANMSAPAVSDILWYKSLKYFKRRPWDSFLVLIEDLALLRQYLSCSTASCFGIYIYMLRYYGIISIKPSALHAFFRGVFVVNVATLTRLRAHSKQLNQTSVLVFINIFRIKKKCGFGILLVFCDYLHLIHFYFSFSCNLFSLKLN